MIQAFKKKLKNEKGFTLIELLAVIVILGILAAIAVPSILGIINNSKKDAQVANAQQMVSAAKNAVASNDAAISWNGLTGTLTLDNEISKGYLDDFTNPATGSKNYDKTNSLVTITKTSGSNSITYSVTLVGPSSTTYLSNIAFDSLNRNSVTSM